ncbi:MAG: BID domain-containing protein [Rhizobium sp.]|nr:BID domain-containing protein [Rhizobium sp.]
MGATPHRDGAHRAADRRAAHYGAMGERVRSPADRQPSDTPSWPDSRQMGVGQENRVPVLVPAITSSARTVDQVAREEAAQHLLRKLDDVRSLGAGVFVDRDWFVEMVAKTIQQRDGDVSALAKAVAERPEAFGALRGKAGLFGENRERKEARRLAGSLGAHVGYTGKDWIRRYEQAVNTEKWRREKEDVIEVPGLSPASEAILKRLDGLDSTDKPAFLKKIVETPEGKRALAEAEAITDAMQRRFGNDDLRSKNLAELTRGLAEKVDLARVEAVVRVAYRANNAEMFRQQDLVRSQRKGLGLRM